MIRLMVHIGLNAVAFVYILPMIGGINFHGTLMNALVLGLFFGVLSWAMGLLSFALSALLTISTWGLALLVLIPMWLLGFWLLPTIVLKLMGDLFPSYLVVSSWGAAGLGGLVMFFIGAVTDGIAHRGAMGKFADQR